MKSSKRQCHAYLIIKFVILYSHLFTSIFVFSHMPLLRKRYLDLIDCNTNNAAALLRKCAPKLHYPRSMDIIDKEPPLAYKPFFMLRGNI